MKRVILTTSACILLLANWTARTQTPDASRWLIEAKQHLQQGDNTARAECFEQAKALLSKCAAGEQWRALSEYYLGYADYRLGVVVHRMDKEKSIAYLDSAVGHLERAIELQNDLAEAHALLSSCYGMKIAHAPLKGILLGPKSGKEMEKAGELSPQNPRVALLRGISTYNTPSVFGGGKEKGLTELMEAASLFDRWSNADSLMPDWGKAEVHAWIGLAHLDRDETILARKAFERALQINPDYGWVRYILLPKVTSDTGSQ